MNWKDNAGGIRIRGIVRVICCLLLMLLLIPGAAARVYIDIDSPGFQKFPLAIADFQQAGGEKDATNLSRWFPDATARYLDMTDYFQIKDRRAFLESSGGAAGDPFKVQFPDWTTIGVDYLVKGVFTLQGRTLASEIRIYDTIKAEEVFRRTYTGTVDGKPEMARKMAGDILAALTGTRPLFETQIAFSRKTAQGGDVFTVHFDGSAATKRTAEYALVFSPHWSPDGRYLSYTSYRSGTPAVYIKDLKQKVTRRVTPHAGMNLAGPWSPDGRKMLLTLSRDGNEEIYSIEIATGILKRLTRHFAIDVSPCWSPDGKSIVFVSNRSGSPQIYVMDADGNGVRRLSYEGGYNTSPAWSPRGDRIAYESRTGGGFQIFTINPQGEDLQTVTSAADGVHEKPAWSPDGRYLAAISRKGGRHRIVVIGMSGSKTRTVYESQWKCNGLAWSH